MRDNKIIKKIFAIAFAFIILFTFVDSTISAAVNREYGTPPDYTRSADYEKSLNDSQLLDYLCKFIFAVGQIIEDLVAKLFGSITGSKPQFPWEDMIIFNTFDFLDVNFINPAPYSIFKIGGGRIETVIKNVYYSVLTLSISLLGLGVAITAIRLAISSIAAEKAKYKQAITTCLYAIIMVASIHFVLAFIFYLNEQLVILASNIMKNAFSESEVADAFVKVQELPGNYENQIINQMAIQDAWGNKVGTVHGYLEDWRERTAKPWCMLIAAGVTDLGLSIDQLKNDHTKFAHLEHMDINRDILIGDLRNLEWNKQAAPSWNKAVDMLANYKSNEINGQNEFELRKKVMYNLLLDGQNINTIVDEGNRISKSWDSLRFAYYGLEYKEDCDHPFFEAWDDDSKPKDFWSTLKDVGVFKRNILLCANITVEIFEEDEHWWADNSEAIKKIEDNLRNQILNGQKADTANIVSNLADIFKRGYYKADDQGLLHYNPVHAILYFILVIQSIMFLFSYVKRLFFVVTLSLLGPIVIIYDFVMGSF